METLRSIDLDIFFWINGHHTPFLDAVMYPLTHIGYWLPLILLALFFLFRHYRKKAWVPLLLFALCILCTDRTSVMIKNQVQRPRPTHNTEIMEMVHVHT